MLIHITDESALCFLCVCVYSFKAATPWRSVRFGEGSSGRSNISSNLLQEALTPDREMEEAKHLQETSTGPAAFSFNTKETNMPWMTENLH